MNKLRKLRKNASLATVGALAIKEALDARLRWLDATQYHEDPQNPAGGVHARRYAEVLYQKYLQQAQIARHLARHTGTPCPDELL